jgi:hypothetical protein
MECKIASTKFPFGSNNYLSYLWQNDVAMIIVNKKCQQLRKCPWNECRQSRTPFFFISLIWYNETSFSFIVLCVRIMRDVYLMHLKKNWNRQSSTRAHITKYNKECVVQLTSSEDTYSNNQRFFDTQMFYLFREIYYYNKGGFHAHLIKKCTFFGSQSQAALILTRSATRRQKYIWSRS